MLVDMKQTFQIIVCILGQQRLNSIFLGCISTYSTPVAGTSRNCMGIVLKTKHLSSGYLTRTVVTTCTSFVLYLSELLGRQSLKGCRKVTIYIIVILNYDYYVYFEECSYSYRLLREALRSRMINQT